MPEQIPDGYIFTQPWPAGPNGGRDQVIYYQYKADRAGRTLRGIDEQVAKAEQAVAAKTPEPNRLHSRSMVAPLLWPFH